MMKQITIRDYDLPDNRLLEGEDDSVSTMVWFPSEVCIILGQSNKVEQALYTKPVLRDKIPVYRRPSGGEAVILTPDTLVISAILNETNLSSPLRYFQFYNLRVIGSLKVLGIEGLRYRGISDIAIGEKKILGSSIYRNHWKIFYHAVLNISMPIDLIGKYLKHPPREPEYRDGRPHHEFVTSLHAEGYSLDPEVIRKALADSLMKRVKKNGGDVTVAVSPPGN
jgi:lipoate-protein ligase A